MIPTFKERYEYLRLDGRVGDETFGFERYLNQAFYHSREWLRIRSAVIFRDNGCDLGINGRDIGDKIIIHHMNPISMKDFRTNNSLILNTEYLICVSHNTHNAIHYGSDKLLITDPIQRTKNDTCPWKQ